MPELVGLYLFGVIVCYAALVWLDIDSMDDTEGVFVCALLSVGWPIFLFGGVIAGPFFGLTYTLILMKSRSGK